MKIAQPAMNAYIPAYISYEENENSDSAFTLVGEEENGT